MCFSLSAGNHCQVALNCYAFFKIFSKIWATGATAVFFKTNLILLINFLRKCIMERGKIGLMAYGRS
jgi:hypothetical protein